jgi:hypothetical protein
MALGKFRSPGCWKPAVALQLYMGDYIEAGFRRHHEVLSRARWDSLAVARRLLIFILERLLPDARW